MTKPSNEVISRYQKKAITRVVVTLHKQNDKDIIQKLDEVENKSGYIKESIREKMDRDK